jgi:GAF domain-containing protein/HAMP domain-containing protein
LAPARAEARAPDGTKAREEGMRNRKPMSLRIRRSLRLSSRLTARLFVYFVLLVILPLIVVGTLTYFEAQRTLRENVLNNLTTMVILKEQEINRWVQAMEEDVQLLAAGPSLQQWAGALLADPAAETSEAATAYEDLQAYLDQVLAQKPDFAEILVLEAMEGEVVLSTNRAHEGGSEATSPFFTEGIKATYVQNVYSSPSLGRSTVTIATPLVEEAGTSGLTAGGEAIGVLAVHLDLARLDAIVLERGRFGPALETYVVDPLGALVAADVVSPEAFAHEVHTQAMDAVLLHREDGAGVYDNYRDMPVIGAYRWLDERDVGLLAEIRLRAALAPARRLAENLLLVGGLAALVVGVIAYGVAWWVSRPVQQLAEAASEMADGNLDRMVTLKRDDEIGALARALNRMAAQLRDLIAELEQRVADRTRDLRRKSVHLATAADVGRAATSLLDLDSLLSRVVELVRECFELYYVGLFLIDEAGEYAVLVGGSGEAGRTMREDGHRLAVGGQSMVGRACSVRQARVALDVGAEAVCFDNPLLPHTRSEIALPLVVEDRVLGALDVQSTEAVAFSEDDIAVLQLVADQVAVAVDNALKFSEEARLLEAASPLYRTIHRLAGATTIGEVSQAILSAVEETEADGCTVVQFEWTPGREIGSTALLARWERHAPAQESPMPGPAALSELLSLPIVTQLSSVEDVAQDSRIPEAGRAQLEQLGIRALVVVPLRAPSSGQAQGFLLIDRQMPGRFSAASLRLYEALAQQAAVALEKARLLEEAQLQAWREHHIRDIGDRIASSVDLDQLLRTTVAELGTMVGAEEGYVEMAVPLIVGPRKAQQPPTDGREGEEET